MEIISFISEKMLILIPVCWATGYAIKATEKIPSNYIPLILVLLGGLLGLAITRFSLEGLFQGVLCGGASVGAHQIKRQFENMKS